MTDKRVLTVQDISCIGQCSLTVALPIISACGVETIVLPSAVLSSHTGGFQGFTFRDLTEDIPKIRKHWTKEGLRFDCLYTGYLGSTRQISYVMELMETVLAEGAMKIIDPAMADNGRLYQGFDEAYVKEMARLCSRADIVLPNLTEAAMMTGISYHPERQDETYIVSLVRAMADLGARKVVLKGVAFREDRLGVAIYDADSGEVSYYFTERMAKNSHGTGDCFAASFTGALMQGCSVAEAAAIAADFVLLCMKKTMDDPSHWYGVKFEKALPMLVSRLNQ